ncbi:hypothetical protein C8A03DRAFT_33997 [Achaetomium macrosporum]|uniref:Uncharacterized protein n=1 Tax=Achaetomium macrosporum TaxID=79813 RepID=A0AAN7HDV8_9PEZI|nr:hypothetical protein C8A03DRAFT_33997 [Achaetomium macrosporum]
MDKVVPIGFSLGAVTLISLADQYPEDGDAIVLHGVSWNAATLYPAFFAGFQVAAAQVDPAKWGHIPTSYTTQSTPRSREITCFYGDYDKGILPLDFELRDFDTLGASITIPSHTVYVKGYTGPVFLGNGDEDATFCGRRCGVDPYEMWPNFPNAADHVVKIYPETGHVIHLHRAVTQLIEDTHAFLLKWNI